MRILNRTVVSAIRTGVCIIFVSALRTRLRLLSDLNTAIRAETRIKNRTAVTALVAEFRRSALMADLLGVITLTVAILAYFHLYSSKV